jgi:hypothetical protein
MDINICDMRIKENLGGTKGNVVTHCPGTFISGRIIVGWIGVG